MRIFVLFCSASPITFLIKFKYIFFLDVNFWLEYAGKEKINVDPEEEHDEMELDKKRHLNVVFIGHVGKFIFLTRLLNLVFLALDCCPSCLS